jgi:hypothetical protein
LPFSGRYESGQTTWPRKNLGIVVGPRRAYKFKYS